MPETIDHVAFLSQQIGPRPAGTEEEQQAALYITERLQKEAGLSAVIEDFNSASGYEAARVLCCVAMVLFTVLALFFPVLAFPSMVVAILAAALFLLEVFDRPVLSRLFPKGVSQNVVVKYEPGYSPNGTGSRRRKVVVVARYDSGKVQPELNGPLAAALPILRFVVLGAVVFVPVLSVIRNVFFLHAVGPVAIVFNVLTVIALIVVALPVVAAIARKTADYNEGANCNAAGVAVLMDVAARVGHGRVDGMESVAGASGFDGAGAFRQDGFVPTIHGEGAALAAGLVPEGAELTYETHSSGVGAAAQTSEARLAAAKAALSAFSGKPVDGAADPNSIDWTSGAAAPSSELGSSSDSSLLGDGWSSNAQESQSADLGRFDEGAAQSEGFAGDRGGFSRSSGEAGGDARGFDGRDDSDWFGEPQDAGARDANVSDGGFGFVAENGVALGASAAVGAAGAVGTGAAGVAGVGVVAGAAGAAVVGAAGAGSESGVPDWFKKAQEKAKKPKDDGAVVQRSRYADALDAAQAGAASLSDAERSALETEQRLQSVRNSIMEAKAPTFDRSDGGFGGGLDDARDAMMQSGVSGTPHDDDDFSFDGATCALPPINVDDLRAEALSSSVADASSPSQPASSAESVAANVRVAASALPVPSVDQESSPDALASKRQPPKRRSIALPNIGSAAPALVLPELQKQRAPLADIESAGKDAAKSLLTMLPSIDLAGPAATQGAGQGNAGQGSVDVAVLPAVQPGIQPGQLQGRAIACPAASDASAAAAKNAVAGLRGSLPSLSGVLPAVSNAISSGLDGSSSAGRELDAPRSGQAASNAQEAFVVGATGTFAPVGQELLKDADPDDLYIDDVDDSDYEEYVTETGAFAGPGYMEMPKSRMQRLLSKFSFGKKKQDESTPQQWLDVDDSFDARSVGAARGGWESFRAEDDVPANADGDLSAVTSAGSGAVASGAIATSSSAAASFENGFDAQSYSRDLSSEWNREEDAWDNSDSDWETSAWNNSAWNDSGWSGSDWDDSDWDDSQKTSGSKWYGGAFSRRMMRQTDETEETPAQRFAEQEFAAPPASPDEDFLPEEGMADELGQIHRFHHASIDTEVWFVALGSELAQNGGMHAFLVEHAQDLRGSIVIELDGLGAGELSLVEKEGAYRSVAVSSRMKRYVKKASQATGLRVPAASLHLPDSASVYAMKQGYQAMHLVGMDGAKPAYYAQSDDVLENIDAEKLSQNSAFVMELLRNI